MDSQLLPQSLGLPPRAEVRAFWEQCAPVTDDAEVAGWLQGLRSDPYTVAALDLARVLPADRETPRWTRYGPRSWQQMNYRVLVPLYDASGEMTALYARSLRPLIWTPAVRSIPPVVGPAGHVMVNAGALAVLRNRGAWPEGETWKTVIIAGGAADFLDWASAVAAGGPAVFGIVPGSWTRELASRIPAGSRVIVRAHLNPIASRYAHRVQEALGRRCEVIIKTAA